MKILILSCSTGGGHNSCAKYIQEELKENNIPCEFKDFYNIVVSIIRPSDKIIGRHVKKVGKARKIVKRRLCRAVFVTDI